MTSTNWAAFKTLGSALCVIHMQIVLYEKTIISGDDLGKIKSALP